MTGFYANVYSIYMHAIQSKIIKDLTLNENLRYSQLKPAQIDGNLFSYHLKELLKREFIIKDNDRYTLTPQGAQYVARLSLDNSEIRVQPKVVTAIVYKYKDGSYLMLKKDKQPFYGYVSLPYGKIHVGERLADAASRELYEKTGLRGECEQKGVLNMLALDDVGDVFMHTIFHIFTVTKLIDDSDILTDTAVVKMSMDDIRRAKVEPGTNEALKIAAELGSGIVIKEVELQFD